MNKTKAASNTTSKLVNTLIWIKGISVYKIHECIFITITTGECPKTANVLEITCQELVTLLVQHCLSSASSLFNQHHVYLLSVKRQHIKCYRASQR